ncbi:hypothetical protein [Nocardiopsis sp. NPDC058789]|uniref:hypothetical protein n=1 Tax=Nocardiopsis TaxID=2013 RepID=UPI00366E227C
MKRTFRTTVLALATSGLVVLGSAACSSEAVVNAVSGDSPQTSEGNGEGNEAAVVTEPRSGKLEFVAPGEFMIDGEAFFVSEETRILGGHHACPAEDGVDDDGFGIVECDLESLEAATQSGTDVHARAEVLETGNAESITEYDNDSHQQPEEPVDEGATGGGEEYVVGELEYIAPGEYMIDGTAFFVSEDTVIIGGVNACAGGVQDPDTGDVACDFDRFDATLANGTTIMAEVEIADGMAESITEF